MRKRFENTRTMYAAVEGVFDIHESVISALPALGQTAGRFKGQVGEIDQKISLLETLGVSKTQVKSAARLELEATMKELGSNLISFAAMNGRLELHGQVKVLLRSVERVRDTQMPTRAGALVGLLSAELANLGDFGVDEGKVTVLSNRSAAFSASMLSQMSTFAARKAGHADLAERFRAVNRLLREEMDMLVNGLKSAEPGFYADYWNARTIPDLGYRRSEDAPAG